MSPELSSTTGRRIRSTARHLVDRVVAPYVDRLSAEVNRMGATDGAHDVDAAADSPDTTVTSDRVHMILHELRTIELERVPRGARRAVSIGASGRWYFDWFEAAVGNLDEHIGIEAFEPRPPDLPGYVTWIEATADRFEGVADASVDLAFAGQTTEHLWAHELVGFLSEAARTIRPGGHLVLDSPNRLVTEQQRWSHGGHTVELDAGEISELVTLAGFDVESVRGIWACTLDGRTLELEEDVDDPSTLARRIAEGPEHPERSFIWWLVARRSERPSDEYTLGRRCREMFRAHWTTRAARGMWPGPPSDRTAVGGGAGSSASLPFPLHPGRWRLRVERLDGPWGEVRPVADITLPGDHPVHRLGAPDCHVDGAVATWEFDRPELLFALTLTVGVEGGGPVTVRMPPELHSVAPADGDEVGTGTDT